MFVVCNSYWILEILMHLNERASSNEEFQNELKGKYGDVASDAVNLAISKTGQTSKKLKNLQSLPNWKKATFSLVEAPLVALLLLWEIIFSVAIFTFDGFEEKDYNTTARVFIGFCALVANLHTIVLAFLVNFVLQVGCVTRTLCWVGLHYNFTCGKNEFSNPYM